MRSEKIRQWRTSSNQRVGHLFHHRAEVCPPLVATVSTNDIGDTHQRRRGARAGCPENRKKLEVLDLASIVSAQIGSKLVILGYSESTAAAHRSCRRRQVEDFHHSLVEPPVDI